MENSCCDVGFVILLSRCFVEITCTLTFNKATRQQNNKTTKLFHFYQSKSIFGLNDIFSIFFFRRLFFWLFLNTVRNVCFYYHIGRIFLDKFFYCRFRTIRNLIIMVGHPTYGYYTTFLRSIFSIEAFVLIISRITKHQRLTLSCSNILNNNAHNIIIRM